VKFEEGKVYQHSSGAIMKIVGRANTTGYGECLVGEKPGTSNLYPIGMDEDAAHGWREIDESIWNKEWGIE